VVFSAARIVHKFAEANKRHGGSVMGRRVISMNLQEQKKYTDNEVDSNIRDQHGQNTN
jgi:hypothetical protein